MVCKTHVEMGKGLVWWVDRYVSCLSVRARQFNHRHTSILLSLLAPQFPHVTGGP